MLRAIQLMRWPLDMICSVDIWATKDIPAELPPMVSFKDEYDQKVLDWFGIPVSRLCAMNRSQTIQVERERERASQTCSTLCVNPANTSALSLDSQRQQGLGAKSSNTNILTYEDLFYRPCKSKYTKGGIRGFPIRYGNWCTSDLKRGALRSPLRSPWATGKK